MKILLSGFEPFGNWTQNPSENATNQLDGMLLHNEVIVVGEVIPLRFKEIKPKIESLIALHNPDAVVLTGQAGGEAIRLETTARNLASSDSPYNCGTVAKDEILIESGEFTYSSTLPLERFKTRLEAEGVITRLSDTAGTFGCNQIFYYTSHLFRDLPSGFIHVPRLPSQTDSKDCMEQETITKAIKLILDELASWLIEMKQVKVIEQ